jgi:DNA polymerase III epsilon subunit family exonuclease
LTATETLVLSDSGEEYRELMETTFVAVDVETTGSRARDDAITEIGAYKIQRGEIIDGFEVLINPGKYIPYGITLLTGITNEMVTHAPALDAAMPQFLSFLGDAVLIAHNAPFDVLFLNCGLSGLGMPSLTNQVLCSCKLGRRLMPGLPGYSLNKLAGFLGIKNRAPHRAGGDAETCAKIFAFWLYLLPEKGIFSLKNLINYA